MIETGEYWRLKKLKKLGFDLNYKDKNGETPLHYLIENLKADNGSNLAFKVFIDPQAALDLLKFLVANGVDLEENNLVQKAFEQALFIKPNLQLIKFLLEHGANPNPQEELCVGATPLHAAILKYKDKEMIGLLIDHGADLDAVNKEGQSCRWLLKAHHFVTDSPLSEEDKEYELRKLLGNIWQTTKTETQIAGEAVRLEGGYVHIGQSKSVELFQSFAEMSPKKYVDLDKMSDLIEEGHKKSQGKTDEIAQQFKNGETLIFASGWTGHAIQVAFVGDYMLIANRGEFRQDASISIFKIDRSKGLDLQDINKIVRGNMTTVLHDPANYFYHELPVKLGYKPENQDLICETVEKNCRQKDQTRGTCWWTSPSSGILGILTVVNLVEAEKALPNASEKTKKKKFNEIFKSTRAIHKYYNEFSAIEILKEYVTRPPDKAERDHQLVKTISERLETKGWKHIFQTEGFLKRSRAFFARHLGRTTRTKIPPLYRKQDIYQWLEDYKKHFDLNENFEPIQ